MREVREVIVNLHLVWPVPAARSNSLTSLVERLAAASSKGCTNGVSLSSQRRHPTHKALLPFARNILGRQTQIPQSAQWGARDPAEEAESPDPRSQPQTDN